MLISKNVEIILNPANKFHYIDKGYDYINGEKRLVPIKHLTLGSSVKVEVSCDYCDVILSVKYKDYIKRIKKHNNFSCNKCKFNNIKITNLKKYGVENVSHSVVTIQKIKKTKLDKYNDENYCNVSKIKETKLDKYNDENYCNPDKIKETNLNRYGVENIFQLEETKEKSNATKFKLYGDENYRNIEKGKKTNFIRYGVENYRNIEKRKKTNFIRYGVDNVFQLDKIKEKIKKTNIEKYGYPYFAQSDEFWKKFKRSIKFKEYKGVKYQTSYELKFLMFCEENNISVNDNVPKFKYYLDGKVHRYIPDYFIKNKNLIIEIKSTYWLNCWLEKNKEKSKVVLESGYNYMMILDNNFLEFKDVMNC